MYPERLDFILQNAACRGAFKVEGETLKEISSKTEDVRESAVRTRNLWASLPPSISDAGLVVATRGSEQSIASARGGIILEASGSLNLGMLKAVLQEQEEIQPTYPADATTEMPIGQAVLWDLADWIAAIETPRNLQVHLGKRSIALPASKGQFYVQSGKTVSSITKDILDAAAKGVAIELGYTTLPDELGAFEFDALDLFGARRTEEHTWLIGADGTPIAAPVHASFNEVAKMASLARQLTAWRDEKPFELAVLRDGRSKEIVATSDTTNEIQIKILPN